MRFLRFAVTMVLAAPLFAGCGLFVSVRNSTPTREPATFGPVATVRVFNCWGQNQGDPEHAGFPTARTSVTGTAEGLVSGRRVSVPLKITKLNSSGESAIQWQPPNEGAWVLNLRIQEPGEYYIGGTLQPVVGAVIPMRLGGEPETLMVDVPATPDEVEAALGKMASPKD